MSCSPFDLHDYLLGELAEAERRQVDVHVRSCGACQEEMERLRITQSTLLELRDEEVPQRIGFVSDPVFEPSGLRRFWRAFWTSGPKLGFASAAMLSAALVIFTFLRPVPAVPAGPTTASLDTATIEQLVSQRVTVEVHKAVAESEARQERKTADLLAVAQRQYEQEHRTFLAGVSYLQKQYSVIAHTAYEPAVMR